MTADGNWTIVVGTPMGERRSVLSIKTDGATLSGTQTADENTAEIFDGSVNGDAISWKVSITDPMAMTLEFNGMVNGNQLSGSVMLGAFGNASFSGARS